MMPDTPFLDRYLRGDHTEVWSELAALPETAYISERVARDSAAVAQHTMTRVRQNCEELARRLGTLGYVFSDPQLVEYPPGTFLRGHLLSPAPTVVLDIEQIEQTAGPVPLSLRSFWQYVGAVAFVGQWPSKSIRNDLSDPLWVYGPDATLADVRDFESNEDWVPAACVAPDYLHKGDISGGPAYSVALGRSCADACIFGTPYERDLSIFVGRQSLFFVGYLRNAILAWGGFPGFRRSPALLPTDTRRTLTADLIPF